MEDKIIIGIDSSLSCSGVAILKLRGDGKTDIISYTKIITEMEPNYLDRFNKIVNRIIEFIDSFISESCIILIETPNTARNLKNARMLIGVYQAIRLAIFNKYGIIVEEVNTKTAKMNSLGNGNIDKYGSVKEINRLFKLDLKYHKTNKEKSDDDVADAISIAYYGVLKAQGKIKPKKEKKNANNKIK